MSVYRHRKNLDVRGYERHHVERFRFACLNVECFFVIDPTIYFNLGCFQPHRYPEILLSEKRRLKQNNAVRGQVIIWNHLLVF